MAATAGKIHNFFTFLRYGKSVFISDGCVTVLNNEDIE